MTEPSDHPAASDAQDRYRALADSSPLMLWGTLVGAADTKRWCNAAWHAYTGMDQVSGDAWLQAVHADDRERCRQQLGNVSQQQAYTLDYRLWHVSGDYRWVLEQGIPQLAADGTLLSYGGSCLDIHERKLAEQQQQAELLALSLAHQQQSAALSECVSYRHLYESILATVPDFVYVFDLNTRFTYVNETLLKMYGRNWEQTVGKDLRELGYENWHAELHEREIEQVRSTKQPLRGQVPFNGEFGRRIYDYIFTPLLGDDGEVRAVAGTTRDVTDQSLVEQTLRDTQEALQLADRRKDEFLAMLAHELRNPLAPISAAAQIMMVGQLDEQRVKRSSQVIERQVRHMVGLVDDLLDVSRVTRGQVTLDKLPQDIKAILQHSIEQVRPLIEAKQHVLTVKLGREPAYVLGDHKRLVQVFANLLNNAAKYTPEYGTIQLSLQVERGADASTDRVVVRVRDNGIGIAEEDQAHIFELFTQTKRNSDRSQGGLGLGLALVKSMLTLHDGYISCASLQDGGGSEFTVLLPLYALPASLAASASDGITTGAELPQSLASTRALKVMVVDDNVDAALTLASFLELNGHQVVVEHEAMLALARSASELPQVFVLDIGLPDMDGKELARRLRADPLTASCKLIAVTGYGQEQDRQDAIAAGFDYHLVKPVDAIKLAALIADISRDIRY